MSDKTMLDLGGLAFMEGDPLGLRDLEESLMWKANGPLPDWLDGAEPPDDDDVPFQSAEPTEAIVDHPPAATSELPLPPVLRGERVGVRGDSVPRGDPAPSPPIPLPRSAGGEGSCVTPKLGDDADDESIFSNQPPLPPELPATVVIVSPHESGPAAPSLTDAAVTLAMASLTHSEEPAFHGRRLADVVADAPPSLPLDAELIDADPPLALAETASQGLVSIDDILRFVDDEPPPAPVALSPELPAVAPAPARRFLSFDELIDARLCLLTSVADRLWAIPLDRVAAVAPRDVPGAVDLFERQEGKKRRGAGVAIAFDSDAVVIVDRIHGPRSFGWEQVAPGSDTPDWMLAETIVAGQRVGLLDWEVLTS